jgi:hypothetical protein
MIGSSCIASLMIVIIDVSNANDFRLWIYCLCGSPMQNLEREDQVGDVDAPLYGIFHRK